MATTLKGKTLFITGASRGIGKAIGLRAAQDGANVVIAAKTDQPHPKLAGTIHTAAEEIEKAGGRALACVVDVRSEDQIKTAVEAAVKKFGGDKIKIEQGNGLMLLAGKDGAQGWVPVPNGHWIVCAVGDKSDLWPVHPEIFAATYRP